jgi:hypothetical protein
MNTRCFLLAALTIALLGSPPALRAQEDETEEESASESDALDDVVLIDWDGKKTTFAEAFGSGTKVVLVTKPWSESNTQVVGELKQYRIRLNKGGLRSGVVFLRSDRSDAIKAMSTFERKVRWYIDPDGTLARRLNVETMPTLALVDPEGQVRFSAPLLASELVKQLARNYNKPDAMFRKPRAKDIVKPGIPPAKGGLGRYSIR